VGGEETRQSQTKARKGTAKRTSASTKARGSGIGKDGRKEEGGQRFLAHGTGEKIYRPLQDRRFRRNRESQKTGGTEDKENWDKARALGNGHQRKSTRKKMASRF